MELSAAAQWVISRTIDLAAVIGVGAFALSGAARLGIYCLEQVRKTWTRKAAE